MNTMLDTMNTEQQDTRYITGFSIVHERRPTTNKLLRTTSSRFLRKKRV